MGALSAGVGLGKTMAVGETAGDGDTTSGVDVAGGVRELVGGKLTTGVDVASRIGAPVGGKLATGTGLHAAIAKHTSKTALNTYQRLFICLSSLHAEQELGSCADPQVDDCFSDRSGMMGKILAACVL